MSHNTLLHRALRPAVTVLAGLGVSPDLVTGLRLATGLGAAACFAVGPGLETAGAGVFLLSMLLDRADGELARQRQRFSRFGPIFDLASDCISTMAAFVGLGLGAAPPFSAGPRAGLLLGLAAAAAVAVVFMQLGSAGGRAGPRARPFDPDDLMLVVPLAVWCGGAGWILLLAGLLAPVAAILVAVANLQSRRMLSRG